MDHKQYAEFIAEQAAEFTKVFLADQVGRRVMPNVKLPGLPKTAINSRAILIEQAEAATAEGATVRIPKHLEEDTSLLLQEAEKMGSRQAIASQQIQIFEKNAKHIFRDAPGHLLDTPKNRILLLDLASNVENFLGYDKYNTAWCAKTLENGKQIWAGIRENTIRYGGLNELPKVFNPQTGLSKLID